MEVSSWENHLFRLGPYFPWQTVSHNQVGQCSDWWKSTTLALKWIVSLEESSRCPKSRGGDLADVHGFSVVVFHLWKVVDREIIPIIRLRIGCGATPVIAGRILRESAHGSESSWCFFLVTRTWEPEILWRNIIVGDYGWLWKLVNNERKVMG